jgi:hypothetical protein
MVHFAPTYYGHGHATEGKRFTQHSVLIVFGPFELMWIPMEELLSGRAFALHYYNLAYDLPLYVHIDLRTR